MRAPIENSIHSLWIPINQGFTMYQKLPFSPMWTDDIDNLAKLLAHLIFPMASLMPKLFSTFFLVFFSCY